MTVVLDALDDVPLFTPEGLSEFVLDEGERVGVLFGARLVHEPQGLEGQGGLAWTHALLGESLTGEDGHGPGSPSEALTILWASWTAHSADSWLRPYSSTRAAASRLVRSILTLSL